MALGPRALASPQGECSAKKGRALANANRGNGFIWYKNGRSSKAFTIVLPYPFPVAANEMSRACSIASSMRAGGIAL